MSSNIVIIDGNSLINRAYYAMMRPMITKEGVYTQGIFGFLNMLLKIIDTYEPEYMAVAWDRKAPTFRHESYSEYKAGRRKMPPELAMELPIMKDILTAMNISNLEIDGFEADDIIGTVSRVAEEQGIEPLIITGDKDALQLASGITKVLITKKGISDFDIFDEAAMLERYELTPSQFIDLKGLMGDKSDNIPGIPGIGEVTGIKLLKQFGTVAELLANSDQISNPKLRAKVEENAQLAAMSRRLAEIYRYVPIEFELSDFKMRDYDKKKLIELFTMLEFNTFLKRFDLSEAEEVVEEAEIQYATEIIRNGDSLDKLNDIKAGSEVYFKIFGDHNHVSKPGVDNIALLNDNCFLFIETGESNIGDVIRILQEKKLRYAGHDLVNDYYTLFAYGIDGVVTAFDTAVAQYVLDPSKSDYSLKILALEYLHKEIKTQKEFNQESGQLDLLSDNTAKLADYALDQLDTVRRIRKIQEAKLKDNDLQQLTETIEFPLIEVLASMENEGIEADSEELKGIGELLGADIRVLENEIYELSGENFNINSPIQLGEVLFEKLGLPAGKKTKRGYSTSADVLEKLKDKHPVIEKILQYRAQSKLKSTYVDGMLPLIGKDGRIRAHFQQTVAATGRLSCTEPNLQNIPIRQEMGRKLRKAFVAGEGKQFVGADYSQIELRILAHMAKDENLISAFNNGEDIHRITAARVFDLEYDQVTPLDRSRAKAVNFGVIYGMSGFGLAEEIKVSRKEAERYIADYFHKHPKVREFMDNAIKSSKELGYSTTICGRKRYIHEINSSNFMMRQLGERLAMNSPIQGSAADVIKLAMIKVYRALKEACLKSKLILQIHDELIIQAELDELEAVKSILKDNMENAMSLDVELTSDMGTAASWYDLK